MAYIAFSLAMFPRWNSSVEIPLFPLLATGAWLFGKRNGLILVAAGLAIHFLITGVIYEDLSIYYQDKLLATLLSVLVVILAAKMRESLDAIKEANKKLDRLVAERNAELDALAAKLITRSEETRVTLGQELHDGIGQLLTGIKLYCTSLSDQLRDEQHPCAPVSDSIMGGIGQTHEQVRRIARTLFPIRIGQVGLISALRELSDCLSEIHGVDFDVEETGNLPELSEKTALQLYRICQEKALFALDNLKANQIALQLSSNEEAYLLEFSHNGLPQHIDEQDPALRLHDYRLLQISGTAENKSFHGGRNKTVLTIPRPKSDVKP